MSIASGLIWKIEVNPTFTSWGHNVLVFNSFFFHISPGVENTSAPAREKNIFSVTITLHFNDNRWVNREKVDVVRIEVQNKASQAHSFQVHTRHKASAESSQSFTERQSRSPVSHKVRRLSAHLGLFSHASEKSSPSFRFPRYNFLRWSHTTNNVMIITLAVQLPQFRPLYLSSRPLHKPLTTV